MRHNSFKILVEFWGYGDIIQIVLITGFIWECRVKSNMVVLYSVPHIMFYIILFNAVTWIYVVIQLNRDGLTFAMLAWKTDCETLFQSAWYENIENIL